MRDATRARKPEMAHLRNFSMASFVNGTTWDPAGGSGSSPTPSVSIGAGGLAGGVLPSSSGIFSRCRTGSRVDARARCSKAHVSLNCPLSAPSGHVVCVCARSPRRDHNAPPQRSFERHEQQRELSASSAPYEFREVLDQICSLSGKPAPRCSRARTAHGPAPPTGLSSMSTCKSVARYSCEHEKKLPWYYLKHCQHSFTTRCPAASSDDHRCTCTRGNLR